MDVADRTVNAPQIHLEKLRTLNYTLQPHECLVMEFLHRLSIARGPNKLLTKASVNTARQRIRSYLSRNKHRNMSLFSIDKCVYWLPTDSLVVCMAS
jgi:hypothetical protein